MELSMRMFLTVFLVMVFFQASEMGPACRKMSKLYKEFCPGDRVCNDTCKAEDHSSGFCQLVPKHQVCMCFYPCP